MTARQCRASVISGTRKALKDTLKHTLSTDLMATTNELLRRLGSEGRVADDCTGMGTR